MNKTTLRAGTKLYHGTDCDDFDESVESLSGPAWLSSSEMVAHSDDRDRSYRRT